jgi:hypothetical protein
MQRILSCFSFSLSTPRSRATAEGGQSSAFYLFQPLNQQEVFIMTEKNITIFAVLFTAILCFGTAFAHTPLCACYDNGDGTITCEGGFSDGSSAAGVSMVVEDNSGKVLLKGKMDEDSEFTFDKPTGAYKVFFDAGEGHQIEIDGKEIVE